jgi:hypothetical protein
MFHPNAGKNAGRWKNGLRSLFPVTRVKEIGLHDYQRAVYPNFLHNEEAVAYYM